MIRTLGMQLTNAMDFLIIERHTLKCSSDCILALLLGRAKFFEKRGSVFALLIESRLGF